jgi:hypothetical protein
VIIRIKPSTKINFNNFPAELLNIINSVDVINGDLLIVCEQRNIEQISNSLSRLHSSFNTNDRLSFNAYNNNEIIVDSSPGFVMPRPLATLREFQQIPQTAQQAIQADVTEDQTPVRRFGLDEILGDVDEDLPDNQDNNEIESHMEKSTLLPSHPCNQEDEKLLIASSMKNSLGSNINVAKEKITELNRLLARTLVLRNEIEIIIKPIDSNEKVNYIIDQIKTINNSVTEDGFIEKAYINKNGNISILTKRIRTEKLEDDTVRDIGVMEIVINTLSILSETSIGGHVSPILIRNLTQFFKDDEGSWTCGHVHHNGEACFGHVYEQLELSLKSKNILMTLELIIKYIRNPNPDDAWGEKILGFPIITSENVMTAGVPN